MDGYYGKITMREFSLIDFPPDLGGKFLWAREIKVSPGFSTPLIFSPLPNSGKLSFPPHFPSYIFHPPYIPPIQTQPQFETLFSAYNSFSSFFLNKESNL